MFRSTRRAANPRIFGNRGPVHWLPLVAEGSAARATLEVRSYETQTDGDVGCRRAPGRNALGSSPRSARKGWRPKWRPLGTGPRGAEPRARTRTSPGPAGAAAAGPRPAFAKP